jgi:hypothetical protein
MKKFSLSSLLAFSVAAAFAQSAVGAWNGKLQLDTSQMPKAKTAEQQKMIDKALAQVRALTLKLNLKADKTFTVSVPPIMGQPTHTASGTWTQKGRTVTMITLKEDGKPPKDKKPQSMTIDPSGKKMVLVAGDGPRAQKVVFTK